ncbi:DeoR/GlpR transcriptional regulator [Novosphingobium umbonatum]|uniref:DeoR/GlpR transcriptional regulator n=1 Tax=Novosphingobium umbonatum TaxID=1908524 RepID=A0A3S2X5C0_9SPHN|nr:DeoR/GlpR family DNA-binding transcription regulator [Novosphingobium umbonatum]RVU06136.1 DeoR/GlpR transcriptional regulator [Novosphingobium umbonatum]
MQDEPLLSDPVSEAVPAAAIAQRHRAILTIAREAGSVEVDDLAERLGVTPQTIRKDLKILCSQSMLSRVHGGAIVTSGVDNVAYATRRHVATGAKAAIGAAAAALIPNGASLFINIGTTTEAVASQLAQHRDLVVISNNLNVIDLLNDHASINLISVGGQVRRSDRAVVGALAMEFIRSFKVDYALIGASAIDEDGSLLDFALDEVKVTQTIIENARKVILVCDSGKFGRPAPVRVSPLAKIDYFITDRMSDATLREACAQHGVTVIETDPEDA